MKNCDEILHRLFRAAMASAPPAEMPFGFAKRVIALASVGVYRKSSSNNDLPGEYAMADTAIQSNLGE